MSHAEEEVLAANRAFYDAFARRDLPAMEALWARAAPCACVHPGWDALRGRDPVLASWKAILSSPAAPAVHCTRASVHVLGEHAFVLCLEEIDGARLVATNLFAREAGGWKLVHHHAGPLTRPSADEVDEVNEVNEGNEDDGSPSGLLN